MRSSLKAGIEEMESIDRHIGWVADREKYRFINQTHKHHTKRTGTKNRLAFSSNITRLSNLERSRLTEEEKKIIEARIEAMKVGDGIYEKLQEKVLNIISQAEAP